jgi:GNAT superfamily N-acetyltransferase
MIRNATHNDLGAIVLMASKFYETTSYAEWADFCPITVENLAAMMIDTGVMLVADSDAGLVGMVGLVVAPFMFNDQRTAAYEVVWWVDPVAQGEGVGKALLAAIDGACRAKGCDTVQMVHLHNSPPQAAALYERLGYRHTESSYTKRLGK